MVSPLDASVEGARAVESSVVEMSGGDDEVGGAFRRWQHYYRSDYVFCWWITAAQTNLVVRAVIPTSLLYVLCDRGPPTISGLGAPIRAQRQGPNRSLGLLVEIN